MPLNTVKHQETDREALNRPAWRLYERARRNEGPLRARGCPVEVVVNATWSIVHRKNFPRRDYTPRCNGTTVYAHCRGPRRCNGQPLDRIGPVSTIIGMEDEAGTGYTDPVFRAASRRRCNRVHADASCVQCDQFSCIFGVFRVFLRRFLNQSLVKIN